MSNFLSIHQGIQRDSDQIFIGPGSKELLYQSVLIFEGHFIIPKGSWVSYIPQIKSKGGTYSVLETALEDNFKLTANCLEAYLSESLHSEHILILNSPNNPTGATYSDVEYESLAAVCRKYKVIVFSDEIYSQINFLNAHSPSISKYYSEGTIVFGGLSKVFSAGGYRFALCRYQKNLIIFLLFTLLCLVKPSAVCLPQFNLQRLRLINILKNYNIMSLLLRLF